MVKWIGCPDTNFRHGRPFGLRPEAIVVHIMDGSFSAGESVFRNPDSHKSAHYGVNRCGEIHQYVDENDTAFHAGIVVNPTWPLLKARVNPNFYTIGIEHEGRPDDVWPQVQLLASAALIGEIAVRWNIALDELHVIRHHQIRASKTCPGNWVQISELLKRVPSVAGASAVASAAAAPDASGYTNALPLPGSKPAAQGSTAESVVVRTLRKVNLRRGKPSTAAPVLRVVAAHTDMVVCSVVTGEQVDGNANWYTDVQGNFFWAGATDAPDAAVFEGPERVRASGVGR